jgi:hypothetical protein
MFFFVCFVYIVGVCESEKRNEIVDVFISFSFFSCSRRISRKENE